MRFANEFGACEITTLPGSPQVAVSHAVFVFPQFRGTGKGTLNHVLRLKRLKALGYNYVLATTRKGNIPEEKILIKHGWKPLDVFLSSATEHAVQLWGKTL